MYTTEQLLDMTSGEFGDLLGPLTRRDLSYLLTFLKGYAPDGVAAALNHEARANAGFAARIAAKAPSGTCPECGETGGWHRAPCDAPLAQQTASVTA